MVTAFVEAVTILTYVLFPCSIGIGMNVRLLDALSNLFLPFPVGAKPGISLADNSVKVGHLFALREACHQLGLSERDLMALVYLPQVVDLAVEFNDIPHLGGFCLFPGGLGH